MLTAIHIAITVAENLGTVQQEQACIQALNNGYTVTIDFGSQLMYSYYKIWNTEWNMEWNMEWIWNDVYSSVMLHKVIINVQIVFECEYLGSL